MNKASKNFKTEKIMTGSRRPTNIPPPSPERNNDNDSEEEEDFEEEEDLEIEERGDSENDDSAASGATTPLTREIRSYEERNQELSRRLREFEEERRHQNDIQEGWKNAVTFMEAKLSDLREKVEGVERDGATVMGRGVGFTAEDLETIANIEKEVEELRMLIRGNERYESGSDQQPEVNNGEGSNMETVDQTDDTQTNAN